jgi:L-threonylcarbamoyladenylate synthase
VNNDASKVHESRGETALPELFAEAAAALRKGQLVVFPTETFYAIGADPMQPDAIAAVIRLKGREPDKPIALIAADALSAFRIAREIPPGARLLADTFWPGPVTLVLPGRTGLNEVLIGPSGGVGVRVSPHPTARSLAAASGGLLTATSANLSGEPPARTLAQAQKALGALISVYLDGGTLTSERASTVVDFGADRCARIVRPGVIDRDAIVIALGAGK